MNAANPAPASRNATIHEEMPYESHPFRQTHPDRLATLSVLLGLEPPPLPSCRVLELGCASGGNLLPLAVAYPHAQFAGVDVSAVQIAQGQAAVDACGLGNVRLLTRSVTDIDERLGKFDYIIAHDLYSWVPNNVQDAILNVCSRNLTEQGVAYVSYNTLPGWRVRGRRRGGTPCNRARSSDAGARLQLPRVRGVPAR